MRQLTILLMTVLLCSLSAWSQKTLPVFTTVNELFSATVMSANDAKSILKSHGLATDESCIVKDSKYSRTAKILSSVTDNEDYGPIVVEVTYDYYQSPSKFYAVSFMISQNYMSIFKGYLKKNNYKFLDEKPDFP